MYTPGVLQQNKGKIHQGLPSTLGPCWAKARQLSVLVLLNCSFIYSAIHYILSTFFLFKQPNIFFYMFFFIWCWLDRGQLGLGDCKATCQNTLTSRNIQIPSSSTRGLLTASNKGLIWQSEPLLCPHVTATVQSSLRAWLGYWDPIPTRNNV